MTADERSLHQTRQTVLSGCRPARVPRSTIEASWQRMCAHGLDPGATPSVAPLDDAELERCRAASTLAPLLPQLRDCLQPPVEAQGLLMVVTDTDGRVLWRGGQAGVRRMADGLGFVGGSAWTERNVGTNAIGTSLVLGEPVQVQGAEHFVETHTQWGCAAAPLLDPWTGRTLGVLDVSGPARQMDPTALALVRMAARLAAVEVKQQHSEALERLRAQAAPLLARVGGSSLVIDQHGHVATASGMPVPERVTLPPDMAVGAHHLPWLGWVNVEALPGGWLLRPHGDQEADATATTDLELDLTAATPRLRVSGASGSWTQELTPRHAELLIALLESEHGRTAAELAEDLFADATRTVTVRAELSRLRRSLGPVLRHQPYRISEDIDARLRLPHAHEATLPGSSAPVVAALRQTPRS